MTRTKKMVGKKYNGICPGCNRKLSWTMRLKFSSYLSQGGYCSVKTFYCMICDRLLEEDQELL